MARVRQGASSWDDSIAQNAIAAALTESSSAPTEACDYIDGSWCIHGISCVPAPWPAKYSRNLANKFGQQLMTPSIDWMHWKQRALHCYWGAGFETAARFELWGQWPRRLLMRQGIVDLRGCIAGSGVRSRPSACSVDDRAGMPVFVALC
jgi:hypothetical protein